MQNILEPTRDAARTHDDRQPMAPEEFQACRLSLGYNHDEMAKALRLRRHGAQVVGEWEKGRERIPDPVSLAIEYLLYLRASGEPLPDAYLEYSDNATASGPV